MFKVFKPIREVGPEEVVTALHRVLNGELAPSEHRRTQGNGADIGSGADTHIESR
jgi:hypothetical protein